MAKNQITFRKTSVTVDASDADAIARLIEDGTVASVSHFYRLAVKRLLAEFDRQEQPQRNQKVA